MHSSSEKNWTELALTKLSEAGHRSSTARSEVVKFLGAQSCCLTVKEIAKALEGSGSGIGVASVYRAVERLEELGLLSRVDNGSGSSMYEPALPSGDHHHHIICTNCGTITAFEDERLEDSVQAVSAKVDHRITSHEITLHGLCARCQLKLGE